MSRSERNGSGALPRLLASVDRRAFLKACGALGVGAVAGGLAQSAFRVVPVRGRGVRVSLTRARMGTYVTMTAVSRSRTRAQEAIGRAFDEMDRLIGLLSRHDGASALCALNAGGALSGPPPELVDVLGRAQDFHRATGGAFDVTVAPLVELFKDAGDSPPDRAAVGEAMARVGANWLEVGPRRIAFARSGMSATLDGIAKGYIVDRASDVLSAGGLTDHLVNAGGDVRVRGRREDGSPWRIAVEDPEKNGRRPHVLELTSGAVATSGSYEVFFDDERIHHHIVDPRTGRSPSHSVSATVAAPSVMEADALSTATFVLAPDRAITLIDSVSRAEALLLSGNKFARASQGWHRLVARGRIAT